MKSVLGRSVKTLLLRELSWPPVCGLEQAQRYAVTSELMHTHPLGAVSGLSFHTLLHTCGKTGVSANRSHWVQLPVMFLGVCVRLAQSPLHWVTDAQGFPTLGKSPAAQSLWFPTWKSPRPSYGDGNFCYWGKQRLQKPTTVAGIEPVSIRDLF